MPIYYSNSNRTVSHGRFQFTSETGVDIDSTLELEALVLEGILRTDTPVLAPVEAPVVPEPPIVQAVPEVPKESPAPVTKSK